jgi:hypothetical protein
MISRALPAGNSHNHREPALQGEPTPDEPTSKTGGMSSGKSRGKTRFGRMSLCRPAPTFFLWLALWPALCVALPLFAAFPAMARARQLNFEANFPVVVLAAYAPTRTACHFTSGPLAGTTGEYDAPNDLEIGAPCDDGKGNRGTVVALHIGGAAHKIERPAQPQPSPSVATPTAPAVPAQQLPAQKAPIAAAPHPDASTVYADLTDAQIQQEFDRIVKQAGNGAIRYNVPPEMTVGQPVTVQVEVSGAEAPQSASDLQATGSGNLKVTPLMEVDLSAPNSPGMFTIVSDPVQTGQQLVPDNGKADWVWTVTPLEAGQQPGSLEIDAYMVLNAKLPDGQAVTRQITSYTVQVPVKAQSALQAVLSFLGKNWSTLLGFILPSGAGVTFLVWFLSKKKPKRKTKVHSA